MVRIPRGRLVYVSTVSETQKNLVRSQAQSEKVRRLTNQKKIEDRKLASLIERGKLETCSQVKERTYGVSIEAALVDPNPPVIAEVSKKTRKKKGEGKVKEASEGASEGEVKEASEGEADAQPEAGDLLEQDELMKLLTSEDT